jgi:hypothetical protein
VRNAVTCHRRGIAGSLRSRLPELSSIPFTALLADFRLEALRNIKVSTGRVGAAFISHYEKEIDLAKRSDEPEFLV